MSKFCDQYRVESARLKGWDYASNAIYFVTICAYERMDYFGEIKNRTMILNDVGMIAKKLWTEIPKHFSFVRLDEYVVMPDHIHGIVVIDKFSSTPPERRDEAMPRLYQQYE
jgi:REP element-mobilizing transposase RayT